MNTNCSQHQQNQCEFLHLNPNTKNILICSTCINESNGAIKPINCIPIKQILEANSQTIILQYPPLTNTELTKKLLQISSSIDGQIKQIQESYQNFIRSFKVAVKNAILKSNTQIDQLQQLRQSCINKYAEIAQIESLKQLVQQQQNAFNQNSQLCNFLLAKSNETRVNTNKIITQFQELQQYQESFSEELPNKYFSNILKDIENISFFNKSNTSKQLSPLDLTLPKQEHHRRSIIDSINIKTSNSVENSQDKLKIDKIDNQIHIQTLGFGWGQCAFENILDPKKKYILTINTIVEDKKDPYPYFCFGIMPFQLRHNEQVNTKGISYFERNDSCGISKMIKGQKLHLGDNCGTDMQNCWRQNGYRRFEVRMNLQNRILKVGSLPDYALVAEIDDKKVIDLAVEQVFAIYMVGLGNVIVLEDVSEVDAFDDLM